MKPFPVIVFCAALGLAAPGAEPPGLIIQEGRAGFIDNAGHILVTPRYACLGRWSGGRLWVQEESVPGAPGTFLDERARPVAPAHYRDLSAVRPELPLPEFEHGLAVVGLVDGGYGYVAATGMLLARTTAAGAFQRQAGDLLLYDDDGRIGFVGRDGARKIPARFDAASPFKDGCAAARAGGRWGLIDASGNWTAGPSFDDLIHVQDTMGLWAYRLDGRWGLLDSTGRRLTDAAYDAIGPSYGRVVAIKAADGWGLVAGDGLVLVAPRYKALAPLGEADGFWAAMKRDGKWGIVATNGIEQAAFAFDLVDAPAPGIWIAAQSGSWGILDPQSGAWRLPPVCQRMLALGPPFAGWVLAEQRGRWGVADAASGRLVLPAAYARIRPWGDWLAVEQDGAVQLLDRAGNCVREWTGGLNGLPPAEKLREGPGVLRFNGGATLVTGQGVRPWLETFDDAGEWSGGLLAVQRGGLWGYVRQDAGWQIQPAFSAAGGFAEGVAPAGMEGRWGLIDETGSWRVKPVFDGAGAPWHGRVPVMRRGKWGLVDFDGADVLPCVYDGLEWGVGEAGEPRFHGAVPDLIPGLDRYGK
jgi:hypothetical protein